MSDKQHNESHNGASAESYDSIVIYHARCPDGVTGAWCFTKTTRFGAVKFYAATKRDLDDNKNLPCWRGKHVFFVDFSFKRVDLLRMHSAASITILDHHKSAQAELAQLAEHRCSQCENGICPESRMHIIIDLELCGAEVAWRHIFNDQPQPWFFCYVRDRDLWRHDYEHSYEFSAAFNEIGHTIENVEALSHYSAEQQEEFIRRGKELEARNKDVCDVLLKCARYVMFGGKWRAVALESCSMQSDLGNEIIRHFNDCEFAVVYCFNLRDNNWSISLRSRKGGPDVSVIAAKWRGGGHARAAGIKYSGSITDLIKPYQRTTAAV